MIALVRKTRYLCDSSYLQYPKAGARDTIVPIYSRDRVLCTPKKNTGLIFVRLLKPRAGANISTQTRSLPVH